MKKLIVVLLMLVLACTGHALADDWAGIPGVDVDSIDFQGKTVTYLSFYSPFGGFEEGARYEGRLEEAKERFNIGDIVYVEAGWGDPIIEMAMSRHMAGDAKYDIWVLPSISFWPLATSGALLPLNSFLPDEYFEAFPLDVQVLQEKMGFGGQIFALGLGESNVNNIDLIFWNKTMFAREGWPALDELYLKDEWTWDQMEQIAIQATRDNDGDGVIDQWGFGGMSFWPLTSCNSAEAIVQDETGRWVFNWTSEAAITAFETFNRWQTVLGLVSPNWDTTDFINGTVAMYKGQPWQLGADGVTGRMEDEWGIVPFPKGPHADDYLFPRGGGDNVFLPASAEYPEGLVALHNFLWRIDEVEYEREEMRYEYVLNEFDYELLLKAEMEWDGSGFHLDGLLGPDWDDRRPFHEPMNQIQYQGESPAVAWAAVAPMIQELLDQTLNAHLDK